MKGLLDLLETVLRICIKAVMAFGAGFVALVAAITRRR
jgi:hypothetical protein